MDCININQVCKLIAKAPKNYVNLFGDYIQWTDGYCLVNMEYNPKVISKLFECGGLSNYKNPKPVNPCDLKSILDCITEIDAEPTKFTFNHFITAYAFKVDGQFYFYNEEFINVFKHVTNWKAALTPIAQGIFPCLHPYFNDELLGVVLPYKVEEEVQKTLKQLEGIV